MSAGATACRQGALFGVTGGERGQLLTVTDDHLGPRLTACELARAVPIVLACCWLDRPGNAAISRSSCGGIAGDGSPGADAVRGYQRRRGVLEDDNLPFQSTHAAETPAATAAAVPRARLTAPPTGDRSGLFHAFHGKAGRHPACGVAFLFSCCLHGYYQPALTGRIHHWSRCRIRTDGDRLHPQRSEASGGLASALIRGGSSAGQSSGLIIRQVVGSIPTRPTLLPAETVLIWVPLDDLWA